MEPIEALSRYKLGKLSSKEIVLLADAWLSQGVYTESLGELLSFVNNPIMVEVGPLFESAMNELRIRVDSKLDAAEILIKCVLQQIVNGQIDPAAGASILYWDVHHAIMEKYPDKKYVGDNLGLENIFCWLREVWDCDGGSMLLYYNELPRQEAQKKHILHIVEEASKWLEQNAT